MRTNTPFVLASLIVSLIFTQACKKEALSQAACKDHTISTSGKSGPTKGQSSSGSNIPRVNYKTNNKTPGKSNTSTGSSSAPPRQTYAEVRAARGQKTQERAKLVQKRDILKKTFTLKKDLVAEKMARHTNLIKLIQRQSLIISAMEKRGYQEDSPSLIEARANLKDYMEQKKAVAISGDNLHRELLAEVDQIKVLDAQIDSIDNMDTNGYWAERYADAREYENELADPKQSKQTPSSGNNYIGLLLEAAKVIDESE